MGCYYRELTQGSQGVQGNLSGFYVFQAYRFGIAVVAKCTSFQEELGIEYDEDVGVNLQSNSDLLQHGKKRLRGQ